MLFGVFFISFACEEKQKETWTPERGADVSSNEAPRWAVSQQPARAVAVSPSRHCYAALPSGITLTQGQTMPDELEIDCSTQEPLNAVNFRAYMSKLQQAIDAHNAREQQQQMQAQPVRQQVLAQQGPQGIQQQQYGCTYRYPGVFSASNPMAGMCANSQEEIDAYMRSNGATQDRIHQREMNQLNANAVTTCHKICNLQDNPSLCKAGCPTN